MIKVLLFARFRELVGQKEIDVACDVSCSVRAVAEQLEERYQFSLKGALCAVNEHYVEPTALVQAGDTLAFFPPVSGGSEQHDGQNHFFIGPESLDMQALQRLTIAAPYGAVTSFMGTVRSPNLGLEVEYIDYEGYEAMIKTQMQGIAAELRERHDLGHIVLAHRLGRLYPEDISIAIVIASPHRKDSLLACHEAIDLCKERLPVWKYEVSQERQFWVKGQDSVAQTL